LVRAAAAVVCALFAGCQQKMADQPSYGPLEASRFFADGQASRPLVPGTVPRGHLRVDAAFYTGREPAEEADENRENEPAAPNFNPADETRAEKVEFRKQAFERPPFIEEFPIPVTEELLEHGYHRFMIYCVVCHDPLGDGRGKIVERGYTPPPSYHNERLRSVPVGHLFAVITEGYGSMPSYRDQIPPRDRWAIAAYVRALQLSQHFPREEMTDEMRDAFAQAAANSNLPEAP
jgi:mono/diheme cytochrome c family protein